MFQRLCISAFLIALVVLVALFSGCGNVSLDVSVNDTPIAAASAGDATKVSAPNDGIGLETRTPTRSTTATATRSSAPRSILTPTASAVIVGFETIGYSALPPQARDTIELIASNGPFPYRQDGQVFQNREGLLPKKASGYYREYTVETPGSSDRGARRIIRGNGGELFYTDDHYESFKVIVTHE